MTREDLIALARRHAEAERNGDMAATLATLEPDPVYELEPVGRAFRGVDTARRYYEHFFGTFRGLVESSERRAEWITEEGFGLENVIHLRLPDGTRERHAVIGILVFGKTALAGERVWGSERLLRLMMGPAFDASVPVGPRTERDVLAYFATPGPLTDLGVHAARARDLPDALPDLCRVVQGLVMHPFLAHLYGVAPDAIRLDELEIRGVAAMLDRVQALDPRPLDEPRAPGRRFVGNCRHFAVLLCAFLRARGLPARARCGFGAYFQPGRFEDHWVCEVWDEARGAWRLVDAQLDGPQRAAFRIGFDPLDVPRTEFLVAGDAWQRCRGGEDPERFGILDLRGLWFVRGNLVRDLAALARRELLPWDGWGLMATRHDSDAAELALLDRVAALTQAEDDRHAERLRLQDAEPGLRVPRLVVSFNLGGATVDLGPGVAN